MSKNKQMETSLTHFYFAPHKAEFKGWDLIVL